MAMEDNCERRSTSEDAEACDQTIPDLDNEENIVCRDTLPGFSRDKVYHVLVHAHCEAQLEWHIEP